jgi:hypothetical protein
VKVLLLLAVLAIPVQAQAPEAKPEPEGILISPAEREALVREFGKQQEMLEELLKRYKNCMTTRST